MAFIPTKFNFEITRFNHSAAVNLSPHLQLFCIQTQDILFVQTIRKLIICNVSPTSWLFYL